MSSEADRGPEVTVSVCREWNGSKESSGRQRPPGIEQARPAWEEWAGVGGWGLGVGGWELHAGGVLHTIMISCCVAIRATQSQIRQTRPLHASMVSVS